MHNGAQLASLDSVSGTEVCVPNKTMVDITASYLPDVSTPVVSEQCLYNFHTFASFIVTVYLPSEPKY